MTDSVWTDDRIDRLKTLWSRNLSASAVARDLGAGITRNAVLSKVHRMGLSKAGRNGAAEGMDGAARKHAIPDAGACGRHHGRIGGKAASDPEEPVPATATSSLLKVGRHDCRFPYGDPRDGPLALCGRAVARGVYCAAHGRIAYQRAGHAGETLMALAGLA